MHEGNRALIVEQNYNVFYGKNCTYLDITPIIHNSQAISVFSGLFKNKMSHMYFRAKDVFWIVLSTVSYNRIFGTECRSEDYFSYFFKIQELLRNFQRPGN